MQSVLRILWKMVLERGSYHSLWRRDVDHPLFCKPTSLQHYFLLLFQQVLAFVPKYCYGININSKVINTIRPKHMYIYCIQARPWRLFERAVVQGPKLKEDQKKYFFWWIKRRVQSSNNDAINVNWTQNIFRAMNSMIIKLTHGVQKN